MPLKQDTKWQVKLESHFYPAVYGSNLIWSLHVCGRFQAPKAGPKLVSTLTRPEHHRGLPAEVVVGRVGAGRGGERMDGGWTGLCLKQIFTKLQRIIFYGAGSLSQLVTNLSVCVRVRACGRECV